MVFVFCQQKTSYEMLIIDWSSDVCSSDLVEGIAPVARPRLVHAESIALVFRAQVGVAEVRARNVDEGAHVPGRCQTVGQRHYRAAPVLVGGVRSEARRVGKGCVRTCESRWVPSH